MAKPCATLVQLFLADLAPNAAKEADWSTLRKELDTKNKTQLVRKLEGWNKKPAGNPQNIGKEVLIDSVISHIKELAKTSSTGSASP